MQRTAKLKALACAKPALGGTLAHVKVRCGNPNCRCAAGEKHTAWIISHKVKGKSTSFHVPLELVEDVKLWVSEHRRLKKLLQEISSLSERIVRIHVKSKRAAGKNRARAAQILSASSSE
jgi:hypothetical protein